MTETMETLPGENETQTITRVRKRRVCEFCGEPAHFKQTFLLPNARNNPASKAYGRNDCSWCSDAHQFSCRGGPCTRKARVLDGYGECSIFPAIERFAHMFLYWEEKGE